jgi:Tol biopolymer transport system component
MKELFAGTSKLHRLIFAILVSACLTCCGHLENGASTNAPPTDLFTAQIAFTSRRCECGDANIKLLTWPDGNVSLLQGHEDYRAPAWSPDGRMIAMLSYISNTQRVLRIVDLSAPAIYTQVGSFIYEFAWSADGTGLFYLEKGGNLYRYTLLEGKTEYVIDAISGFSVSPNGQWLGLSIYNPAHSGAFTFRVLDLSDGSLLTTADPSDISRLGANLSTWSPITDEVAVLFGPGTSQSSKVVIYTVQEEHLSIKATAVAQDTYQHDFGRDLPSVEFSDPTWSPDGEELLVIRSTTDANPGGEALLFDAALSDYERLPFGDHVTRAAWRKDGRWLAYVVSDEGQNTPISCPDQLGGEIWLANMETLDTQLLVTDTLYIEQPAWQP